MNVPTSMPFHEEVRHWKKILENYCQVNALLKYRLSEIVDNNEDSSFLQMAEYFQTKLLLKDEKLKKLAKQINAISNAMEAADSPESIIAKHEKLRKDICLFEKKYEHLSKEFNEKLLLHS